MGGVRELADGSLLVVDLGENRLVVLDSTGSFRRDLARTGGGPGEYVRVGSILALGGDSTLVTDAYSFRWNVYVGSRLAFTVPEHRDANRRLRAELVGADTQGRLLAVVPWNPTGAGLVLRNSADSLALVVGWIDQDRLDTLAVVRGRGGGVSVSQGAGAGPGRIVVGGTIAAEDRALMARDGSVAVVRLDPYRVDWVNRAGDWTEGPPLPSAHRILSRDEACYLYSRRPDSAACPLDRGLRTAAPAFVSPIPLEPEPTTLVDLSGHVVIARAQPSASSPRRYEAIGRDGRLSSVVVLEANQSIVGFGRRGVYVVDRSEDGLRTLTRRPWPARL